MWGGKHTFPKNTGEKLRQGNKRMFCLTFLITAFCFKEFDKVPKIGDIL